MQITFTGSNAVGKSIQKVAADTLKRGSYPPPTIILSPRCPQCGSPGAANAVTLELGGKNACLILEDADVDTAVKIASGGNYFNSGQVRRLSCCCCYDDYYC